MRSARADHHPIAALVIASLVGILSRSQAGLDPGRGRHPAGLAEGGATCLTVFAVATTSSVTGAVVKLRRARPPRTGGHPATTPGPGSLSAGFFVVPVVGLFLGFVLGVYLAELARVGSSGAWPSAVHSLKASARPSSHRSSSPSPRRGCGPMGWS